MLFVTLRQSGMSDENLIELNWINFSEVLSELTGLDEKILFDIKKTFKNHRKH